MQTPLHTTISIGASEAAPSSPSNLESGCRREHPVFYLFRCFCRSTLSQIIGDVTRVQHKVNNPHINCTCIT
eukprot:6121226-Amphidinium_carterae.1